MDDVILRVLEAQKLRIATVYLKFLQRRKSVKEQAEAVRLFRYNPYEFFYGWRSIAGLAQDVDGIDS